MPNAQLLCSVLGVLSFLVFKKMTVFTIIVLPGSTECLLIDRTLYFISILVKYGKYTRLNNLEMIVDSLENKPVAPEVKEIISSIKDDFKRIKEDFINNKTERIDLIVSTALLQA